MLQAQCISDFRFLVLVLLLIGTGCSQGSGVELVPVEGVVTLDGKPVEGAEVLFRPESGRPSAGRTDAEGKYALNYTREEMGAVPGQHQVLISTFREPDDSSSDTLKQVGSQETIPQKYNRKTTLSVDVIEDDVFVADFELVSK